ncbi:MAG: glycerol-3-phosphate dehydrogenase/oxidase [Bacillota bacterium]
METREQIPEILNSRWDIVVIGGGITGAGVLREASGRGLRCLLLEQRDFAWGTSSRSGKLVHGGLRYLAQGQVKTTWHSVRQREMLLRELTGLVEPVGFLIPSYGNDRLSPLMIRIGLALYDTLAMKKSRRRYGRDKTLSLAPHLKNDSLTGGLWYRDAQTDDARLVLRIIREAERKGGVALNYARVEDLCLDQSGRVRGVAVRDVVSGRDYEVQCGAVISATGVWADRMRSLLGFAPRLRRLRGSHLVFPRRRLPVSVAISFMHPEDRRPLYVFPWEGVTLLGTTDLDHEFSLDDEPGISPGEGEYLLGAARKIFPSLGLSGGDVISTFSGVRPVVDTGKKNPSRESREHVVWSDNGLVTVTGGKLTTFALIAREAVNSAVKWLSHVPSAPKGTGGLFDRNKSGLPEGDAGPRRLAGRFGADAAAVMEESGAMGLEKIPGTETLWAEIQWAARHEGVVHLDDLLLRRVRIGLQLPMGGLELMDRVRSLAQPALNWTDKHWEKELGRYRELWRKAYSPSLINQSTEK